MRSIESEKVEQSSEQCELLRDRALEQSRLRAWISGGNILGPNFCLSAIARSVAGCVPHTSGREGVLCRLPTIRPAYGDEMAARTAAIRSSTTGVACAVARSNARSGM